MVAHGHNFGNNSLTGPLHTKHLGQLLQVMSCRFTNREDSISQPTHAEVAQLLVEELHTKLAGEERNVFDNGQSNSPLLILGQLDDGREE